MTIRHFLCVAALGLVSEAAPGADFASPPRPVAEATLTVLKEYGSYGRELFSVDGKFVYCPDHGYRRFTIHNQEQDNFVSGGQEWSSWQHGAAISPSGKHLVLTGRDGAVGLARLDRKENIHSLDRAVNYDTFSSVTFLDDERCLLGCAEAPQTKKPQLMVWNIVSGEQVDVWPVEILKCPAHRIHVLAATPHGRMVALASDGRLTLHDGIDGGLRCELARLPMPRYAHYSNEPHLCPHYAAFSPSGRYLAVGGMDGLQLFDVLTRAELPPLCAHDGAVVAVRFSNDGQELWTLGRDLKVFTWKVAEVTRPFVVQPRQLTAAEIEQLLDMAASESIWKQHVALKVIAAAPEGVLAAVKRRVPPLPALAAEELRELTLKLKSEEYNVRRRAAAEIGPHGEQVVDALLNITAPEPTGTFDLDGARLRLRQATERGGGRGAPGICTRYPTQEMLAQARLVAVLVALGDDDAKTYAHKLAGGYTGSTVARSAAQALARWPVDGAKGLDERSSWEQVMRDLQSDDASRAYAAVSRLALDWGAQAVHIEREIKRLDADPSVAGSEARAQQLIQELESDDPAVRDAAAKKLVTLGHKTAPQLRAAQETASIDAKGRLQAILGELRPSRPGPAERALLRLREARELSRPTAMLP